MEEKKVSEIVDVRQACCYTTLATPIKNAIATTKPDEILEIIVKTDLKEEFGKLVKEEGYQILEEREKEDEIHFKIKK